MTALLNHQLDESRAIFKSLHEDGLFSNDDAQLPLANFFVEAGRFLATDQTIPANVAGNWKQNTFEDLALLLFGLKDWEMSDFDDANTLFDAFLAGKPAEPYGWIAEYAPIARKATHDYALYAPLEERLKAGAGDKAALQEDFTKAQAQLQTSGKLVEAFFAAESELNSGNPPALAATNSPAPTATSGGNPPVPGTPSTPIPPTEAQKADGLRWQTARNTYQRLVGLGRFDGAQSVIDQAKTTVPEYERTRELIATRVRLLVAFKKTILNDLKVAGGYPLPVTSLQGMTYPRGIQGDEGDMLLAGTPYGQIGVPWTDFSPAVYLAVASHFADASRNPQQAATRRWLAANYALENGRLAEAKTLANAAANVAPQYRKELAQFDAPVAK